MESVIKNEVGARLAAWPAKHAFEYVHARAAKASAADSSASAFGRKRNKSKPKKVPSKAVQVPVPRTEEEKRKDEEAITALMATLPTYASLREKINKMFATSRCVLCACVPVHLRACRHRPYCARRGRFLDSLGRGRTEWRGAERNLLDHSAAPPPDAGDAVQAGETVLRVSVYNQSKRGKIQQEFLVLGSQRLTELKDRVYCLSDFMLDGMQHLSSCAVGDARARIPPSHLLPCNGPWSLNVCLSTLAFFIVACCPQRVPLGTVFDPGEFRRLSLQAGRSLDRTSTLKAHSSRIFESPQLLPPPQPVEVRRLPPRRPLPHHPQQR